MTDKIDKNDFPSGVGIMVTCIAVAIADSIIGTLKRAKDIAERLFLVIFESSSDHNRG